MTRHIRYVPRYRDSVDVYVYAPAGGEHGAVVASLLAAGRDLRVVPLARSAGSAVAWHIRTRGGRWLPLAVRDGGSSGRPQWSVWVAITRDS
jgi:hypothetical protein